MKIYRYTSVIDDYGDGPSVLSDGFSDISPFDNGEEVYGLVSLGLKYKDKLYKNEEEIKAVKAEEVSKKKATKKAAK